MSRSQKSKCLYIHDKAKVFQSDLIYASCFKILQEFCDHNVNTIFCFPIRTSYRINISVFSVLSAVTFKFDWYSMERLGS
jgi:hypothetical protein